MPYYLYKLKFLTPVHFGSDKPGIGIEKVSPACHADTLFSSLCLEALSLFGEDYIDKLVTMAEKEDFLLSDLFPYFNQTEFCLPKPALLTEREQQLSDSSRLPESNSTQKKKMKKLSYIPVRKWDEYLQYIQGKNPDFNCKVDYFEELVTPRVAVSRTGGDSSPYFVGACTFKEEAGLYFILKITQPHLKKDLDILINSLQYSGIGGKRTAGYGKFKLDSSKYVYEDDRKMAEMISGNNCNYYMSLSVISPKAGEITKEIKNSSYYTLVPRSGFVYSRNYNSKPLKRKTLVMFNAGSCFTKKLKGQVIDVQDRGSHPVYRYGKAMMMGVKI